MQFPKTDEPADHAYWVSGLRLRDGSGDGPLGTIDVRSRGFGVGDPAPSGTQAGGGVLTGGNAPAAAIGYQSLSQTWGSTPREPVRDRLDIEARNIRHVAINVERAKVDCDVFLHVTTDGPVTVDLPGCGQALAFARSGDSRGACTDRLAPRAVVKRSGIRRRHGRFQVRGRATDRGCKGSRGLRSRRGTVKRVAVSVARVRRHGCRFLTAKGRFTRARSCRRGVFLPAKGTRRWSFRTRRLPAGRYRIGARAVDAAGNRSRKRRGVRVRL